MDNFILVTWYVDVTVLALVGEAKRKRVDRKKVKKRERRKKRERERRVAVVSDFKMFRDGRRREERENKECEK